MYVPGYAALDNLELIHAFVKKHSFGTLISVESGESNANHFPFLLEAHGASQDVLWTHLARSNPQWEDLRRNPGNTICRKIFANA